MSEFAGGLGVLKATGIKIELGSKESGAKKEGLFKKILDQIQKNINHGAKKNQRLNAIDFTKSGKTYSVLIRTLASGYQGFTLEKKWAGDAMFFAHTENEDGVMIDGVWYEVILVDKDQYEEVIKKCKNNKLAGMPEVGIKLSEDEFVNYFEEKS